MNKQLRDLLRIPPNPLRLSEAQIQRAVFAELRLREQEYPQLRYIIHAPNEGKRSAIGGKLAKDGGLTPGVLDFLALVGPRVALELKANDNAPTPAQSWWMNQLSVEGYSVGLAYTADEAIEFFLMEFSKPDGKSRMTTAYWRADRWLDVLRENGAELIDPRLADSDKSRAW
jgi:hypothetical protein